jgi:hypothetical protein
VLMYILLFFYFAAICKNTSFYFRCLQLYEQWSRASKLLVRKLQIRKFFGSFRCRKSANFSGISVCKLKFFLNNPQSANPQIYTEYGTTLSQNSPKSTYFRALFTKFVRRKGMYLLRTCESFKSANHKNNCFRKLQIHKVSQLWKVCKSKKIFQSQVCGFAICGRWQMIGICWGPWWWMFFCLFAAILYKAYFLSQLLQPNY